MASYESERDWSHLPFLLLYNILHELNDILDRISFSVVCKHWNTAYCDMKGKQPNVPLLPMLLVPTRVENNPCAEESGEKRSLYSVTTGKLFKAAVHLPEYRHRFCGSCDGWLIGVRKLEDKVGVVLFLMDPFRRHPNIELPPLLFNHIKRPDFAIIKCVITKHPLLHPDDYVVVAIIDLVGRLAIFRASHNSWTIIGDYCKPGRLYSDALVYKGSVLIVGRWNNIVSLDFRGGSIHSEEIKPWTLMRLSLGWTYLTVTSEGQLLLVNRLKESPISELSKTVGFKVFKLTVDDQVTRLIELVEVNSLGGDVLILGNINSMVVPKSKLSRRLMPNSIYFTGDWLYDVFPDPEIGFDDIGIFHLEDQSFTKHYEFDPESDHLWPPPVWMVLPH